MEVGNYERVSLPFLIKINAKRAASPEKQGARDCQLHKPLNVEISSLSSDSCDVYPPKRTAASTISSST